MSTPQTTIPSPGPARRCIVLGGSGTVGRALVAQLVARGTRVGFSYFQNEEVAEKLTALGAIGQRLDLSDPTNASSTLDALTRELGGVDALVYCATVTSTCTPPRFEKLGDVNASQLGPLWAVNVSSALAACQHLRERFEGDGNIVLVGSIDGAKPVPSPAPYAASKAALLGLTQSLAKSLGPQNVRVNLVVPGILEAGASSTLPEELRAEYLKHCGLRRLGRIDELVSVLCFFALENTYVTGQSIVVDGGL